jgi:LPS export ABC transporter protein LptC
MVPGRDHITKIRGLLLTIGILILVGVISMFAFREQQAVSNQTGTAAANRNATLFITGIHYTDIKEGEKNLELIAESADLHMDEDSANLSNMEAVFFEKNGDKVFLSAESGALDMDSIDLEVNGNVMLKTNQYEMKTETLTYNDSKRLFATQSPSTIKGVLGEELYAERMTYYRDTKRLYLNGNEAEQ